VSRSLSLTIVALAVLAVIAGVGLNRSDGATDAGCEGVRRAYERVSFVERSGDVPTSRVYADVSRTVRSVAASPPPAVARPLSQLADAYVQLGSLFRGFDAADASTYHVYENNTATIERQQTIVDTSLPLIREWLDDRCP
jgi:hypothetical protein